jgi:hypothetical protein
MRGQVDNGHRLLDSGPIEWKWIPVFITTVITSPIYGGVLGELLYKPNVHLQWHICHFMIHLIPYWMTEEESNLARHLQARQSKV